MKQAVIIGGSNGIGLAVSLDLIKKGYQVHILDIVEPDMEYLNCDQITYHFFDVRYLNIALLEQLSNNSECDYLFFSAGIGRVADFNELLDKEIENVMSINALSAIRIIKQFYHRIYSANTFYCAIMGSIAGLVSSPLFSVYAASKAALCRFVESVNIELEKSGTMNRILNICPGSIQGTKFNGGNNDLNLLQKLSNEIINNTIYHSTLFIPNYDGVLNKVISDYHNNPHEYGLHSYEYKMKSGRIGMKPKIQIGYLSGTFDLFHIGHLNLLKRAKQHCDYLIVGIHDSGAWKGKETFIPLDERKEIVAACKYVDKVVDSCTEDSDAWRLWHYNRLFVGSDYKGTERFKRYEKYFADKGVEIMYFPYTKGTSSTQLRKKLEE